MKKRLQRLAGEDEDHVDEESHSSANEAEMMLAVEVEKLLEPHGEEYGTDVIIKTDVVESCQLESSEDDESSAVLEAECHYNVTVTWSDTKMNSVKNIVEIHSLVQNTDLLILESHEDSDTQVDDEYEARDNDLLHLHSFLDTEDFSKPINTPVNKNIGEVLMMLIKYVLANALSLSAIANLFALLNCIFASAILPDSR